MNEDIRWEQGFSYFRKALKKLTQAIEYVKQYSKSSDKSNDGDSTDSVLNEIIKEGLIQRFEYTHELGWNVMKDYALYQGIQNVTGSRDATREVFQSKLISDGKVWMEMIGSRNRNSHTYNSDQVNEIYETIINEYHSAFMEFQENMETKRMENKNRS